MLDHHFAERHPGHQHIYLGAPNPGHSHDFQPFHSHNSPAALLLATEQPPADTADGIVYVTPAGGAGHGIADVTAPANTQSMRISLGDASGFCGNHHLRETIPQGASVPPPTLPPRA